jgi:hypothetical protein
LKQVVDNLDGRIARRSDAKHAAGLVAWQKIADGWKVRQHFQTSGGGDRQWPHSAGLDLLYRRGETVEDDMGPTTYNISKR